MAGDRIRVSVYEKLSLEDDKWSERRRQSRPDETYALRAEMSGESVVQVDATISLPILGSIPVQDLSMQALEDEIRARFREVVGRPAKASVSLLERPPISVVGPVKQPGTYKFTPGMTVLHAVALAGGLDQKPSDNWAGLEVARDAARVTTASQKLSKSLATLAVLRAERDGKTSTMPEQLVNRVGREAANEIFGEAKKRRERLTTALRERRVSLASAVATAERALTIAQERTEILSQGLSSRQKRADALRELSNRGTASRTMLDQAEGDLADMKDRALTNVAKVAEAELAVSNAKQELSRFDYDTVANLDREITQEERVVLECREQLNISQAVQVAFDAQTGRLDVSGTNQVEFHLVRKTDSGTTLMSVDPTTQLAPGDLVQATTSKKQMIVSR